MIIDDLVDQMIFDYKKQKPTKKSAFAKQFGLTMTGINFLARTLKTRLRCHRFVLILFLWQNYLGQDIEEKWNEMISFLMNHYKVSKASSLAVLLGEKYNLTDIQRNRLINGMYTRYVEKSGTKYTEIVLNEYFLINNLEIRFRGKDV